MVAISCAGLILAQDIIVTRSGATIEDVTVISVTADKVTYKQAGKQKTIASSDVDGVMYDDGRYVSPASVAAVDESVETTSDDSWAVEDAPSNKAESTNRREKREKKERGGNNSEIGQAFKDAGEAIKAMFEGIGKKKDKTETTSTESDPNQGAQSASDDGW